jgi:hypothetical protein
MPYLYALSSGKYGTAIVDMLRGLFGVVDAHNIIANENGLTAVVVNADATPSIWRTRYDINSVTSPVFPVN